MPTHDTKKEVVRKTLIKTNPHLNNMEKICSECKREVITSGNRVVRKKPAGLADVLIAIEKNGIEIEMNVYGDIFHIGHYEKPNKEGYYSKSFWALSQDYDHQSEETIDFLYELLCE